MNRTARAQTGAGVATLVALPLLYLGGTQNIPALVVIGFVVFTAGMLTAPLLRFLPPPKETDSTREG